MAEPRKLYLFANFSPNPDGGVSMAIADDGVVLASHYCSNASYQYGDLYGRREERKPMWQEHFGGAEGVAYEVIDLGYDQPPDDVLAKNAALGDAEADGAS